MQNQTVKAIGYKDNFAIDNEQALQDITLEKRLPQAMIFW